jgi:hypothetical protein
MSSKQNPLSAYNYFIDIVSPELIAGWAINQQHNDRKPTIEVFANETKLWQTTAEQPRSDLQEAGLGDSAFIIHPSVTQLECDINEVDIYIDGNKVNDAPYPLEMQTPSIENYQCFVDHVTESQVSGWARCQTDNHRVSIELKAGDHLLGQSIAQHARQDLIEANIGDGHYGYTIQLELANFPSDHVVAHLYVDGHEYPSDPIQLTVSPESIAQAKFYKEFGHTIENYEALIAKEAQRINKQIETLSAEISDTSLNTVTNIAINNIVELSARMSVLEQVILAKLSK